MHFAQPRLIRDPAIPLGKGRRNRRFLGRAHIHAVLNNDSGGGLVHSAGGIPMHGAGQAFYLQIGEFGDQQFASVLRRGIGGDAGIHNRLV